MKKIDKILYGGLALVTYIVVAIVGLMCYMSEVSIFLNK